jgi:hypothetical protein
MGDFVLAAAAATDGIANEPVAIAFRLSLRVGSGIFGRLRRKGGCRRRSDELEKCPPTTEERLVRVPAVDRALAVNAEQRPSTNQRGRHGGTIVREERGVGTRSLQLGFMVPPRARSGTERTPSSGCRRPHLPAIGSHHG